MALFEWEPRYSVHINEFDNHHKKLIELLQKMHQSMLDGEGKYVVGQVLDELKDYTVYHFNAEEKQMEKYEYPDFSIHKAQHKELINQLDELITNYKNGVAQITTDTYKFLNKWLTSHIMNADKKYTAFFKDKGLQ